MKLLAQGIHKAWIEKSEIHCCDLDLETKPWPRNSEMYLQTEAKPIKIYSLNWKSIETALKVKGQGQMTPTSNHF